MAEQFRRLTTPECRDPPPTPSRCWRCVRPGERRRQARFAALIVAYDEIWSIKYFRKELRPYWRRNGATPANHAPGAERDYSSLDAALRAFDSRTDGGHDQSGRRGSTRDRRPRISRMFAGCGLAADANGQPLLFTKENTSNGDIATVDVIFPMDPIWSSSARRSRRHARFRTSMYSASAHWKFPNAPHDLGTYPIVLGRDDGGEGMPVEESGNMLILCDAIAKEEGTPNSSPTGGPSLPNGQSILRIMASTPSNNSARMTSWAIWPTTRTCR